jgi:glycosyltransferase involved in cell wall biosynthesis
MVPKLSVCIPTFSRSRLLDGCLASVLPQVQEFLPDVECVVSDNASPDDTRNVLERRQREFPFLRVSTNSQNIGIIGNITKAAVELAQGEYVYLIGDDDVLTKGAIGRILSAIRQEAPDFIALNVGYRPQNDRPNASELIGGVSGSFEKTLRHSHRTGSMRFEDVLEGPPADLTASYSVIIKQSDWKSQFPETCMVPAFSDVQTTYPSGYVVAKTMVGRSAFLIAEPSVVIYEMPGEEFSWAKFRGLTSTLRATELLSLFQQNGVPYDVLRPYFRYQLEHRSQELADLLWNPESAGGKREAFQFAWNLRRYPLSLLKLFVIAMNHPRAPRLLAMMSRGLLRTKGLLTRRV